MFCTASTATYYCRTSSVPQGANRQSENVHVGPTAWASPTNVMPQQYQDV